MKNRVLGFSLVMLIFAYGCSNDDDIPSEDSMSNFNISGLPKNGLVSYYPFNGNANDSVGEVNGIVNNVLVGENRFGKANSSYNFFFEEGGFIDLGDQDYFSGMDKSFAISTWIKPSNVPTLSGRYATIISKLSQQATGVGCGEFEQEFTFSLEADGRIRIIYYYEDGTNTRPFRWITTSQNIVQNAWVNIVVNYNGQLDTNDGLDRVQIYFDGVLKDVTLERKSGALPNEILNTESHLAIGNILSSSGEVCINRPFEGLVDDVAFYSRELRSEEIEKIALNR